MMHFVELLHILHYDHLALAPSLCLTSSLWLDRKWKHDSTLGFTDANAG